MGPPLEMSHPNEETSRVGVSFVNDYYKQLSTDPLGLVKYYSKDTRFSFCDLGDVEHEIYVGTTEITSKLESLELQGVKTQLSSVKCHASVNDSVLVVVHGALSNNSRPPQSFNQTFVLARSARKQKTFYVVNDFLIFLPTLPTEEIASEEEEEAEVAEVEQPTNEPEAPKPVGSAVESWADETPSEGEDAHPGQEQTVALVNPEVEADEIAPEEVHESKTVATTPQEAAGPYIINSFADALKHGAKAPEQRQRKAVITDRPERTNQNGNPKRPVAAVTPTVTEEAKKTYRRLPPSATRPSVYVAKVPEGTTYEELMETFTAFGPVTSIRNRPMKRIAFVDFDTTEAQGHAIEAGAKGLVTIRGKEIVVQAQRRDPEIDALLPAMHARGHPNREPRGRGARGQEPQKSSASQ